MYNNKQIYLSIYNTVKFDNIINREEFTKKIAEFYNSRSLSNNSVWCENQEKIVVEFLLEIKNGNK